MSSLAQWQTAERERGGGGESSRGCWDTRAIRVLLVASSFVVWEKMFVLLRRWIIAMLRSSFFSFVNSSILVMITPCMLLLAFSCGINGKYAWLQICFRSDMKIVVVTCIWKVNITDIIVKFVKKKKVFLVYIYTVIISLCEYFKHFSVRPARTRRTPRVNFAFGTVFPEPGYKPGKDPGWELGNC